MSNTNDLLNRINNKYSSMSKGQKLLATYITDNYDKAVFLTASKMGKIVGVSESTVVRFATSIGYKGYPEFQSALEELVRNKLNSVQRMEVTYGRISQSEILENVLQADADKIKTTLEKTKPTTIPSNEANIFIIKFSIKIIFLTCFFDIPIVYKIPKSLFLLFKNTLAE